MEKNIILKINRKNSLLFKIVSYLYLLKKGIDIDYPTYVNLPSTRIIAEDKIKIGKNCYFNGEIEFDKEDRVGKNNFFNGKIKIGKSTNINKNCEFIGNIIIGKFCAIARNSTFQGLNHEYHKPGIQMKFYEDILKTKLNHIQKGPIIIGNDVWIGTKAIILSGVTIGDGAVIGAGSVVTKNVEPYSIVAGVPAKQIRWRFSQHLIKQLLEIKWWDWDIKKIKNNKNFFTMDISCLDDLYAIIN
jgi:virginiamycin A acetyltransferase